MVKQTAKTRKRKVGSGGIISTVINKAIDLLPFEAHLPFYQYCGPGTKLNKRLARGDKGINPLDAACRVHDIAYSKYSDSARRKQADKVLAEQAWQRFKASDSSIGEKAAALAVTTAMKAKTKFGGGKKKKKQKQSQRQCKGEGLYLKPYKGRGKSSKKKKLLDPHKAPYKF